MNSSDDLEMLLEVSLDGGPGASDLPARFRAVLAAVDRLGLAAVFIGPVAFARFARARYCTQIDLLLGIEAGSAFWPLAEADLTAADAATRGPGSTVMLKLHAARGAAEIDLIRQTPRCDWFGVAAPLASAKHLFLRFLAEDSLDGRALAVELAAGSPLDPACLARAGAALSLPADTIADTLRRADLRRSARWTPFHPRGHGSKGDGT